MKKERVNIIIRTNYGDVSTDTWDFYTRINGDIAFDVDLGNGCSGIFDSDNIFFLSPTDAEWYNAKKYISYLKEYTRYLEDNEKVYKEKNIITK